MYPAFGGQARGNASRPCDPHAGHSARNVPSRGRRPRATRSFLMSLGIARPLTPMMPARPTTAPDPRNLGEDPARIRATIARAPLFAALPISAIEDLTARVTV